MSEKEKRILIVEDDDALRNAISIFLEADYTIMTADNGQTGLELFRQERPAVVITDIKMPEMTGIELLRNIREESWEVPVIIMTGYGELSDAVEAMRLEAWDFVQKPFDFEDVRQKIEMAFRQYETAKARKELEEIFNTINDAITVHDLDFNIIRANKSAADMLGVPLSELVGSKCYAVYHGTKCPPDRCPSCTARTGQASVNELYEPNLGKFVEFKSLPQFNTRGKMVGLVHIVRDISKEKEALKLKSEFMSNISHELRTPLHGILGISDLLLYDTSLTAEQEEYLRMVKQSGKSMLAMVQRLLEFSSLEFGSLKVEELTFDLHRLVGSVTDEFQAQAAARGLELEHFIEPNVPPKMRSDPGWIREILAHLLSNAVKFTERGQILVSVQLRSEDDILISVRDTGIGIPEHQHELIFDGFIQADGSSTRRYEGLGVGLSLVRKMVHILGGSVSCESVPGKGSIFSLALPVESNRSLNDEALAADCLQLQAKS